MRARSTCRGGVGGCKGAPDSGASPPGTLGAPSCLDVLHGCRVWICTWSSLALTSCGECAQSTRESLLDVRSCQVRRATRAGSRRLPWRSSRSRFSPRAVGCRGARACGRLGRSCAPRSRGARAGRPAGWPPTRRCRARGPGRRLPTPRAPLHGDQRLELRHGEVELEPRRQDQLLHAGVDGAQVIHDGLDVRVPTVHLSFRLVRTANGRRAAGQVRWEER